MRPGHDPRRRNRNIGTAKQGHGQDNRQRIPWVDDRDFVDVLNDPIEVHRRLRKRDFFFYVEPTLKDHVHPCTPDDVMTVLRLLPKEDCKGLAGVVLRQPTRRQGKLNPVWGRWRLCDRLGPKNKTWFSRHRGYTKSPHIYGCCIFLEAQPIELSFAWSRKLDPDDQEELQRLEEDGHRIEGTRREYRIHATPDSCRATMLYRTLPHELGHHVDYMRQVETPSVDDEDWNRLAKLYWSHPASEREAFAHRYADSFRERYSEKSVLPFERMLESETLFEDGLDLNWFQAP